MSAIPVAKLLTRGEQCAIRDSRVETKCGMLNAKMFWEKWLWDWHIDLDEMRWPGNAGRNNPSCVDGGLVLEGPTRCQSLKVGVVSGGNDESLGRQHQPPPIVKLVRENKLEKKVNDRPRHALRIEGTSRARRRERELGVRTRSGTHHSNEPREGGTGGDSQRAVPNFHARRP